MTFPDIKADARRVIDTISAGGIAIVPNDTGYGVVGASMEPLSALLSRIRITIFSP